MEVGKLVCGNRQWWHGWRVVTGERRYDLVLIWKVGIARILVIDRMLGDDEVGTRMTAEFWLGC